MTGFGKILLVIFLLMLAGAGYFVYSRQENNGAQVACTQEAKICPDGSAVGRTGPNCEFAPCPSVTATTTESGVRGTVLAGPQCPVVREGEECPDKPVAVDLVIEVSGSELLSESFSSEMDGTFSVAISPGTYTIRSAGSNTFPYCQTEPFEVTENAYTNITVSCDTGIR